MPEIHVVPGIRERFSIISNAFAQNPDVTPRAARVYLYLRSCPPGWQMSVRRLAEAIGMSTGTVNRALIELEKLGYLDRKQVRHGGNYGETIYRIYEEPLAEPRVSKNDTREDGAVSKNGLPKNGLPKIDTHNKNELTKNKPTKNTPQPPSGGCPPEGAEPTSLELVDAEVVEAEVVEAEVVETTRPELKRREARGRRLPEGWEPDPGVVAKMRAEWPQVDLRVEHEKFTDHWLAAAGANARKRDWNAAWRNWIRKAGEQASRYRPGVTASKSDGFREAGARLTARMRERGLDPWET